MRRLSEAGTVRTSMLLLLVAVLLVSTAACGTVFGGSKAPHERGSLNWGLLVLDLLLFWPGVIVDFLSGAMWHKKAGGMFSIQNLGDPLPVCVETTDRVKRTTQETLDDLKDYVESHFLECDVCHAALTGK